MINMDTYTIQSKLQVKISAEDTLHPDKIDEKLAFGAGKELGCTEFLCIYIRSTIAMT